MAQIINTGKELIRINPNDSNRLEYSSNSGKSWQLCFSSKSCGDFKDLTENGKEILATTSKGLYYSTSAGRSWHKRN